jgi:ABC-2 type transport system ATP-binding protein
LENLRFHGWIHGISGDKLRTTIELRLKQVQLWDRQNEKVEKLSGGLQRRVELAKSLMTEPSLLILDEPSTGLDPALRLEFWKVLKQYQAEKKASILFTTHLMEEADRATHVIFLDEGKKIAEGSPEVLKAQIGGEILTLETRNLEKVYNGLEKDFGLKPRRTPEGTLELEVAPGSLKGAEWIPRLAAGFVSELDAISLRKPTLEDFFLQKTGRKLSADTAE